MEKQVRLSAEQRDDLVAYLDGELPEGDATAIDHVLARSEVARHEVEALARTWEMLDLLPVPKASAEFTERTMTNLKVAEVPFDITQQSWFGPLKKGAVATVWLAVLGLSGWFGFQLTSRIIPNKHGQMLQDMPVLQNLDTYQEVESVDFLEQLKKGGLFDTSGEKG